jgi:hypothetical protein
MGYTTDFSGQVSVTPPLNPHEISFLTDLATTRRMDRTKGPLYAVNDGNFGQSHADDILNYNRPHADQPGLWLQWVPTEDGTAIEWDEGEKFYEAAAWMKYLVQNLLAPSARAYIEAHKGEDARLAHFTCDHVVNGQIEAQGEDPGDRWVLVVRDNVVSTADAIITFDSLKEV